MRRYPEYKESDTDWSGKIPYHWRLSRIDSLFFRRREKNTNIISGNILSVLKDRGVIRYEDKGNIGNKVSEKIENYQLVYADDIVVNNMNVTIGSVGRSDQFGALSGIYIVLAPNGDNVNMGYYEYVFKIRPFQKSLIQISSGLMEIRESLNFIEFKTLKLPTPPLPTQRKIATFLDRKTGQIDELIRIKERRIELLQEQRTTLINQAVTKGLDPNVEMKPSGAEWIGEMPKYWEMINTKYLFRLVTEPAPKNNDYELLSIYTNIGVKPRKELEQKGNRATTTDGYWLVKKGDFIINKLLAWMGAIGLSNYEGVTSPAYDILRKVRPLNERFYEYLFRCGLYFTEFKKWSRGIMEVRLRLYFDQFGQIPLVFPPVNEQDKIVDFLDHKTQQIDKLIATEKRKIELLKEYRQSLIAEAVTGKIDVRSEV